MLGRQRQRLHIPSVKNCSRWFWSFGWSCISPAKKGGLKYIKRRSLIKNDKCSPYMCKKFYSTPLSKFSKYLKPFFGEQWNKEDSKWPLSVLRSHVTMFFCNGGLRYITILNCSATQSHSNKTSSIIVYIKTFN
jgi:hypothetical protein